MKDNNTMNVIGIEIGGSKLQLLALDQTNQIVFKETARVNRNLGADSLQEAILRMLESAASTLGSFDAIGVGFGGPVDRRSGIIKASFHVDGWSDFDFPSWIDSLYPNTPTLLENDTNAAAFGEAILGAGREYSHVLYSNSGSGVGGGLVVNKKPYHGSTFFEMELGHILLDQDGRTVEKACSGWSIDKKIREDVRCNPESELASLFRKSNCGEHEHLGNLIDEALEQHIPDVIRIVDDACKQYAYALAQATLLLNPQIIILGGGVANMGAFWNSSVDKHLKQYLGDKFGPTPKVQLSQLGEWVVPIGAALVAKQHVNQKTLLR